MGVAAGGGGVEVRRAPHAAVDVVPPLDRYRREQPRHTARSGHRVRDPGARGAGASEHDPAAAALVHGRDAQAAVEARPESLDVLAQVAERVAGAGQAAQEQRPGHGPAGRGQSHREGRERGAGGERPGSHPPRRRQSRGREAVDWPGAVRHLELLLAERRGSARRLARDQVRGDDRAR